MNKHWQLRDEWYRIFHQWPALVAVFLIGGLLGWAAGMIWPASSRATREMYVALNPYRAYSDTQFLALAKPRYSNLDNYHYWQMNQLSAAIVRNDILRATLERLRQADPYWNNVDAETLAGMLGSEWRTAGAWRLVAIDPDARHARQALEAWGDEIQVWIPRAVLAARSLITIDQDRSRNLLALDGTRARQETLTQAMKSLAEWRAAAADLLGDAPLPIEMRWKMDALTSAYAQANPAWAALLKDQPGTDTPAAEALAWSQQAQALLQAELEQLPARVETLQAQQAELQTEYQSTADASLGLSPNLALEKIGEVQAEPLRHTSTLALVGAFLGMLAWLLAQIVGINRRLEKQPVEGRPNPDAPTQAGAHEV